MLCVYRIGINLILMLNVALEEKGRGREEKKKKTERQDFLLNNQRMLTK